METINLYKLIFVVLMVIITIYFRKLDGEFNKTTLIFGTITLGFLVTNFNSLSSIFNSNAIENFDNNEAIQNIAGLYNAGKLTVKDLEVTGKATVANGLTVNGGSSFNGGRHYFQDEEKAGRLRVGGAWGIPGIYAEDGKPLILGGANGNVHIRSTLQAEQGSNFNGGRHFFQDEEKAGRLRVGGAWGTPGIYAEDGKNLVLGGSSGNVMINSNAKMNNQDIVTYDQSLSARPNSDAGKCFDFGSDGRTGCDNGWSIVKLQKR
jgi:hypothetical protein